MTRFGRQVVILPLLALGVALLCYALLNFLPGDPARIAAGPGANSETVKLIREQLGLNQSLPVRLGSYLVGLLRGDMGISFQTRQPVAAELLAVFPKTIQLSLLAEFVAIVVGFGIGALSAIRSSTRGSLTLLLGSAAALSLPLFALALLLQLIFSVWLRWLPPSGDGSFFSRQIILPALTLAIPSAGFIMRFVRTTVLGKMQEDYVQTAIANGLKPAVINLRYIMRPATSTLISVVAADLSRLLGGVAIVEIIFGWPGVGKYAFDALTHRDLPALQGALLVITFAVLITNQIAEIAYRVADPRIGNHDN